MPAPAAPRRERLGPAPSTLAHGEHGTEQENLSLLLRPNAPEIRFALDEQAAVGHGGRGIAGAVVEVVGGEQLERNPWLRHVLAESAARKLDADFSDLLPDAWAQAGANALPAPTRSNHSHDTPTGSWTLLCSAASIHSGT